MIEWLLPPQCHNTHLCPKQHKGSHHSAGLACSNTRIADTGFQRVRVRKLLAKGALKGHKKPCPGQTEQGKQIRLHSGNRATLLNTKPRVETQGLLCQSYYFTVINISCLLQILLEVGHFTNTHSVGQCD